MVVLILLPPPAAPPGAAPQTYRTCGPPDRFPVTRLHLDVCDPLWKCPPARPRSQATGARVSDRDSVIKIGRPARIENDTHQLFRVLLPVFRVFEVATYTTPE